MNPDILQKAKELQQLIEAESNQEGQTMIDFFRPTAKKMLEAIAWKVEVILTPILSSQQILEVTRQISLIDAQHLLEFGGKKGFENEPWMHEVTSAIKSNQHLQAVKLYKQYSGVGLKEAKDYVDMIRDQKLYY